MSTHDPNHPYVRKLIGCGHGKLFSEPCNACEIVGLLEQLTHAEKTIQRVQQRLAQLGHARDPAENFLGSEKKC